MRLTVYNGSPRGKAGNTEVMLSKVIAGFSSITDPDLKIIYLSSAKQRQEACKYFAQSDLVLLGFPLYTDAMPGLVKEFIESLAPYVGQDDNTNMAFLVQSGFPEAHHSRFVERYLKKLARRLNAPYAGTIVKGGCEGVRLMPDSMNRKLFDGLREAGADLAKDGKFNPEKLKILAKPERYHPILAPVFKLLLKIPVTQSYWNGLLKKNEAYEKRFATPFRE
jgi:NAD(P)H-dependent FMN reductase